MGYSRHPSPSAAAPSRLVGIVTLLMTGTLAGFLIVSYIPGALGVDSRVATVPFRGLMLLLQLYALGRLLAAGHLRVGMSIISAVVVFFWAAYSLRFIVDAALLQVPLGADASDMALSVCDVSSYIHRLIPDQKYRALQQGAYMEHACAWCVLPGIDASHQNGSRFDPARALSRQRYP